MGVVGLLPVKCDQGDIVALGQRFHHVETANASAEIGGHKAAAFDPAHFQSGARARSRRCHKYAIVFELWRSLSGCRVEPAG
jgi:hypothetical protein